MNSEIIRRSEFASFMKVKVAQSCATLWTVQPTEFSRPEHWSGQLFPSPGDLPNPGIEPRSPTLQSDSLPAEPPGKTKSAGVGSLFLLQQIFLTQESNWGLLQCRLILNLLECNHDKRKFFLLFLSMNLCLKLIFLLPINLRPKLLHSVL